MTDDPGPGGRSRGVSPLGDHLRLYSAENYLAERVAQSVCIACGGRIFALVVDDEEGCAQRRCFTCSESAFIADSAEYWDDADPGDAACPCGGEQFEVGVGFSFRDDGDVRWVTVAGQCVTCGTLGVYADWKIDYSPTSHLLNAV